MTLSLLDARRVPLERSFNFRDLGGYATADGQTVRTGRLYRADGLHALTPADLTTLRGLGLRSVIDLRTDGELESRGFFPLAAMSVEFHRCPVLTELWEPTAFGDGDDLAAAMADRYLEMTEVGGRALARAIALLSGDAPLPAVFHCAAGKDRTGVLGALVLRLLGVADSDIVIDYALTDGAMDAMKAWVVANDPETAAMMLQMPAHFLQSPARTMRLFLERFDARHGSVEAFLAGQGVGAATIERFRAEMLTGMLTGMLTDDRVAQRAS